MLTFSVPRKQNDGEQTEYSRDGGEALMEIIHSTPDMARQEFADETNINVLLGKYGIGVLANSRPGQYREVDYTMDLQQVYIAAEAADRAFDRLPDRIQERFGNMQNVLDAAAAGDETLRDLLTPETPKVTPEEIPNPSQEGVT